MGKTAILAVKIVGDSSGAGAAMDDTSRKAGGLGKALGLLGPILLTIAAALGLFAVKAIDAGGALQQSRGAIDTVFKAQAATVHGYAKSAATDLGIAENAYNELATTIGTQLKNGGTALDQMGTKTQDIMKRGADMASLYGGTTKQAIEAISSALKGERDPIERYGVSLTQAAIDAEAARLGFEKVNGTLSVQASQAATMSLIYKQTGDAAGNFAKEANTWEGQKQRFMAGWDNFVAKVGLALLPVLTQLLGLLNEHVVPALGGIADGIGPVIDAIGLFAGGLTGLGADAGGTGTLLQQFGAYLIDEFWPAAQQVGAQLGDAFSELGAVAGEAAQFMGEQFNDMGPEILGVLKGVAGFVVEYMGYIASVITLVIKGIRIAWDLWGRDLFRLIAAYIKAILGVIGPALDTIASIFRTVSAALRGDWKGAWQGVQDTAKNATRIVTGIINGWKGILSAAGRGILSGFLRGLEDRWRDVQNFVGGIGPWIAAHKGPLSYDRQLLVAAGSAIMSGLVVGLDDGMDDLDRMVSAITGRIESLSASPTIDLTATGTLNGARSTAPATQVTNNITINGAVDARETARQLRDLLNEDGRTRGTVITNGSVLV